MSRSEEVSDIYRANIEVNFGTLVAEDDHSTLDAVLTMLEELGTEDVDVAKNGEQALSSMGENSYEVLLLALMMPKIDGYKVLKEIRQGTVDRPNRVIVMSAHARPDELEGLLTLGADKFIPKPFTLNELESALDGNNQ